MTHEQVIELELAQIGFALANLLRIASDAAPGIPMRDRTNYSCEASVICRKLNKVLDVIEKETEHDNP